MLSKHEKLEELNRALINVKDAKRNAMREFGEEIKGIEKQIAQLIKELEDK